MDTKAMKVEEETIPYERIPGVPRTIEEVKENILLVEKDIAAGVKGLTLEELDKEIATWY